MARTPRRLASGVPHSGLVLAVSVLGVSLLSISCSPAAGARALGGGGGHSAPTTASLAACATSRTTTPTRQGRLLGIVAPVTARPGSCDGSTPAAVAGSAAVLAPSIRSVSPQSSVSRDAKGYSGSPPLLPHSGLVMGTSGAPGNVTVTPIFWDPSNTMAASYKSVLEGYVANVAADDGKLTNVFSTDEQYGAAYDVHAGTAVVDSQAITDGCAPDPGVIYSDDRGYTQCVTDAQIQTELDSVLSAHGLPSGLGYAYPVFLPEGVESCFDSRDNAQGGQCTISGNSGAFCAYHAHTAGDAIYSDLPFPIYSSLAGLSCGPEFVFGGNESPNGQPDADVEVSLVAHELNESITDPLGTSWFDRRANEIADDCLGFYGATLGAAGAEYNQVINGAHYLTQEMFSNDDYHASKNSACIQHVDLPLASFKVTPREVRAGHGAHFNARKSKGAIVTFSWNFGDDSTGSGRTTSHVFGAPGSYTVTLTVTDTAGVADSTALVVAVG